MNGPSSSDRPRTSAQADVSDEVLREIANSLRGLRFGSVQIVVHDGVVVQIDRLEKRRLRIDDK